MRARRSARGLLATLGVLALFLTVIAPMDTASAASVQRIVNGNFEKGTTGWRTGDPTSHQLVATRTGRSNSLAAEIATKNTSTVVLSTTASTVKSTVAGAQYSLALYVRSSKVGATAQVRVLETNSSGNTDFNATQEMNGVEWQKIKLDFSAKRSASSLDLSVRFSGGSDGQKFYVDDVSFLESDSIAPSPDTPPATNTPPATGKCTRPAPPKGTQFGSSISTSSTIHAEQALKDRDAIFGKIAAVRIWDQPMPFSWSDPRTKHLEGRTLVMSFRPKPADVLSGKYDAEFKEWFKSAPSTSTIYWNYYHEPETPIDDERTFSADIYKRAWQHIDKIADSVCRQNMYATLVLMGWTTSPQSKKDWRNYYPGADVIDALAFDPYNGVHDPGRDYYATPASMMDNVVKVAKEAGKPWAIAETGSRKIPSDPTGSKRAAWLTAFASYARTNGALFVTYFHSTRDGEWRLLDKPSQDAWRAAVSSSPR